MPNHMKSNFSHLSSHSDQLLKLGLLAERYFSDDPNTCLLKLRQLAELLAQETAANLGMLTTSEESQFDLIRRLQDKNAITRETLPCATSHSMRAGLEQVLRGSSC
jgi:type I restriction enzyme, R subunit